MDKVQNIADKRQKARFHFSDKHLHFIDKHKGLLTKYSPPLCSFAHLKYKIDKMR